MQGKATVISVILVTFITISAVKYLIVLHRQEEESIVWHTGCKTNEERYVNVFGYIFCWLCNYLVQQKKCWKRRKVKRYCLLNTLCMCIYICLHPLCVWVAHPCKLRLHAAVMPPGCLTGRCKSWLHIRMAGCITGHPVCNRCPVT